MGKTAMHNTIKNYIKTTALHGFKYLYSPNFADRAGWLLCFIASGGCAGVLCTVLWARFLEVPALLARLDNVGSDMYMEQKMPAIIVCPTSESVADIILEKLSANQTEMLAIPTTLARLLAGKSINSNQLLLLNNLLVENNVTLGEVMVTYAPGCGKHMKRCRYQGAIVPCEQLFRSELTTLGVCCVINSKRLKHISHQYVPVTHSIQTLDLVLQFTHGSNVYGCQLLAKYDGEDEEQPDILLPETFYLAQQSFQIVQDNPSAENLMKSTCVSHKGYSRTSCMFTCAEISCGCRDPLHPPNDLGESLKLPICPVSRMECVRGGKYKENLTCNCLPPCREITTSMVLHSSNLNVEHTIEPFVAGLNGSLSIVIHFRVNLAESRVLLLQPTDTWVTLLSSLGGVFNMFLGVGLFSGLEFLFFILIKLPAAIKKSSAVDHTTDTTAHAVPVYRQQHQLPQYQIAPFPLGGRQRYI